MNCYVTYREAKVTDDLASLAKFMLQTRDHFHSYWRPVEEHGGYGASCLKLPPGGAVYFIGGRSSLQDELGPRNKKTIATTSGTGLAIAIKSKITVSLGSRIGGLFVSKIPALAGEAVKADDVHTGVLRGGKDEQKQRVKDEKARLKKINLAYNELIRRTLTMLCVYNSDTAGRPQPTADKNDRMIPDTITFQEVGRRLGQLLIGVIEDKIEARQGAVDQLFNDLNM